MSTDDEIDRLQRELGNEKAKVAALKQRITEQRPTTLPDARQAADAFLVPHGDNPRVAVWVRERANDPDALGRLLLAGVNLEDLFGLR